MNDDRESRILILAPSGRDAVLAGALLAPRGIPTHICEDGPALAQALSEGAAALLITDEALTPSLMSRLAAMIAAQEPWSDLPVLVLTTKRPDSRETRAVQDRVMTLGNVTLLERPLKPQSLGSALGSVLRARRRQYETRALLQRIEREVHQRDQFLAMLGHELRNPLGAMQNACEVMRYKLGDDERVALPLAMMARQSQHLTRLVDDLLDVSRVSAGKVSLQRHHVDLGQIARAAVEQQRPFAAAQRVTLAVRIEDGGPVFGDPVRLDQVVTNLVRNAIKYTPAGGRVDVSVSRTDDEVRMSVRDTGVGMSAETLPYVFELFCQAQGSLDRSQGGMGIGLTLVRSVVELHGGKVTAASAGLGRGSEFTVTLPRVEEVREEPKPKPAGARPATGRRVLIIDDNVDNRESLRELLETYGHKIELAADGPEGVARALAWRPEVAFVDIGLPGFDGYEVARRIRADIGGSVFMIALTGYGQPDDRERTRAAGFDAHLTKPADVADLERLLESVTTGVPAAPNGAPHAYP